MERQFRKLVFQRKTNENQRKTKEHPVSEIGFSKNNKGTPTKNKENPMERQFRKLAFQRKTKANQRKTKHNTGKPRKSK